MGGGRSMRTHREDVEERDDEERRVRPAGGRGSPERRQHERGVVHHRDLRDIHRGEGPSLHGPAAASSAGARSSGLRRARPHYRSCSCSRCSSGQPEPRANAARARAGEPTRRRSEGGQQATRGGTKSGGPPAERREPRPRRGRSKITSRCGRAVPLSGFLSHEAAAPRAADAGAAIISTTCSTGWPGGGGGGRLGDLEKK